MQRIIDLYKDWCGQEPAKTERLAGAGSNRAYYRLYNSDGSTTIGCIGTSKEENHAFITLSRHFCTLGLPVPEVLAVSRDELCYIQQDLGSTSLFDAISTGRQAGGQYNETERELLRKTVKLLPRIQFEGARGMDFSVCYPQPDFDETGVMFDLNYFKYCFLKPSGTDFHELRLENDFRQLARDLTSEPSSTFLYRDFQARNIMVNEVPQQKSLKTPLGSAASLVEETSNLKPQLYFIDFQGGRRGPYYYDLASFLWQASARYPDELRSELIEVYYNEAGRYAKMPTREVFDSRLRLFVFFRQLQVLGAYGYRGYFERKPHFLQSIPFAIDNLSHLLTDDLPYPHLLDVLRRMVAAQTCRLQVRIFSFSYKKGIPQDESGNGGGYVFDCRGTNNPGRYEQYKHLTGLDQPVIQFLEDDGEILHFLDSVYTLADKHIQRYIDRGFTSLMFSFGCTGGQHRSVYSAQHLAEHIRQRFPMVKVQLCHRELRVRS